ncbi:MAG: hypothetical protein PHO15_06925 [Eubacteriales bacterium]|nr:hypothetical protein [Eubacteriales bacterium]
MDIKPVKNAVKPQYPVKEDINVDELKAAVPRRWALSTAAKIALGTLAAMSLAGCTPRIETAGVPTPPPGSTEEAVIGTQTPIIDGATIGEVMPPMISIAPLVHTRRRPRRVWLCDGCAASDYCFRIYISISCIVFNA